MSGVKGVPRDWGRKGGETKSGVISDASHDGEDDDDDEENDDGDDIAILASKLGSMLGGVREEVLSKRLRVDRGCCGLEEGGEGISMLGVCMLTQRAGAR